MKTNQQKKIKNTVGFYDRLSKSYDSSYSAYLNHTHEKLLALLEIEPGDRILDLSCGTGILAEKLMLRYSDIDLVLNDPSHGMRYIARERMKEWSEVKFTDKPAEELQFSEQEFDYVLCLNSFHYYTDQQMVMKKVYSFLNEDGRFYLLDWNREGWFKLPNLLISIFSPENINTRSAEETVAMMKASGFKVRQSETWRYRFWKFYLLEGSR